MEKREQLLSWALAFAVFVLVAWLVANYSYLESRSLSLLSFWKLFGLNTEPFFLYFLFLFPALYFLAKRFTSWNTVKNALLVNSFLLPVYFFFQFVNVESNYLFYPNDPLVIFNLSPHGLSPSYGLPQTWFPYLLLVTTMVLLLALIAVFSEKLKSLKNGYFKWSLVLSLAILFFLECLLISYGTYESNSQMLSRWASNTCFERVSATWTPGYMEGLKPKLLQQAEEHVRLVKSGELRVDGVETVFGSEYLKHEFIRNQMITEFNEQYFKCTRDALSKAAFPKPELVTSLILIPVSIVCVLFSLKVFRKKRFANPVLEKGFLVAAIPIWSLGVSDLLAPGVLGVAYDSAFYPVLDLLALILSASIIFPVAYWLGFWPKRLKRKR